MGFGMGGNDRLADVDRSVERDATFAVRLRIPSSQVKIIRDKSVYIHVDTAKFAEELRMRRCSAVGLSRNAELHEGGADRSPNGPFDKGQPLVTNEHCPSQHAN